MVEKENLARALQRAQAQAVVPLVSEQMISTQGFIERKRLVAAEEAFIVASKNRDESLAALAQGEKRLEVLQSQEKSPFAGFVVDAETELVRLRAQVAELQGRAEMSITSVIPADAMPRLPAELSVWMADRQTDLQEALSTEDQSGCQIEFDVDQGRRAHGRDESSGHFGRRVSVSRSPRRGGSLLIDRRSHMQMQHQVWF